MAEVNINFIILFLKYCPKLINVKLCLKCILRSIIKQLNIHLISIGGAVMHNMALALKQNGHTITGSDDEIFEPSKGRLDAAGLLPTSVGWDANRITPKIDLIILGMHAREGNPELVRASELKIPVVSFPEYIANHSKEKIRVVVGGSHGKTTTTAMIMHVLMEQGLDFDYLVGSQLDGFETMVRLSDAPIIIIEGDEYLSSPLDLKPKFLWYRPHYAIVTGIAWDHINVFPTFQLYERQFDLFLDTVVPGGTLFYYKHDASLNTLLEKSRSAAMESYEAPRYKIEHGKSKYEIDGVEYSTKVVGKHNLENMMAAAEICAKLGIEKLAIYQSLTRFNGTALRLEKWYDKNDLIIFRDFAHSPSKLMATVQGVKDQYPDKKVIAFYELHTYSSLKKEFIPLYNGTMDGADEAFVFFHSHVFEMKKMPVLSEEYVSNEFGNAVVMSETWKLHDKIRESVENADAVILLMSSGTFDGLQKELVLSWL
jgi:UDP-N-acetylmuramate: L-alanyl-gamma-D-glutamyl-meso-diaminopimelate ligase